MSPLSVNADHTQIRMRTSHYDISLNVINLDWFLHISEFPITVKEFTWMTEPNSCWSVLNLLCHLGFNVYWCQVISLASYGKLWVLHVVPEESFSFNGFSQGIWTSKISGAMTYCPSVQFSWIDLSCQFYDGRWGLEICVLYWIVFLMYTNVCVLPGTEG